MRWIHRGKLGDWTEARADSELHQREDRRIHAFQHASVEALLEAEAHMIGSMGAMLRDPVQQKRRRMGMLSKRNKRRKCAYAGRICCWRRTQKRTRPVSMSLNMTQSPRRLYSGY